MNITSPDHKAEPAREIIAALACVLAVLAIASLYLGGLGWLSGTPVIFSGDGAFFYAYAKIVLQSGWNWSSSNLGAPFGFPVIAYPSNLTYETVIMNLLRWSTHDPITLLNRTWATCLCISGLSGYFSLRVLGLRSLLSIALGTLFATIPYAFYRNVGHFNLEFSAIALPVAAAVLGMGGQLGRLSTTTFRCLAVACFVLGLGYVYNAFFIGFLLGAALILTTLTKIDRGSKQRIFICLAIVMGATALNLAPSFLAWAKDGRPNDMDYKNIAESEIYALRIRDLVLPDEHSPISVLSAMGKKSAFVPWPNSNENQTAKIGSVGALGLILGLLTVCGVCPGLETAEGQRRRSAGLLLLLLLLLSLPGAFGSIFNLYVVSDIRAYNRVAPFIALLSLFLFGSWFESLVRKGSRETVLSGLFAAILLVFGFFDQNVSQRWRSEAPGNKGAADELRDFVAKVEASIPQKSMVLMLPITSFPPDHTRGQMQAYDHAKPTLFSHSINWSWPQFSLKHTAWLKAMGAPSSAEFFLRASQSGFTYVWLDRAGLESQEPAIIEALRLAGAERVLSDPTNRYSVYRLAASLPVEGSHLIDPVTIDYHSGFYAEETTSTGQSFHWAQSEATVVLRNTSAASRSMDIIFQLQGFTAGENSMLVKVGDESFKFSFSNVGKSFSVPVHVKGSARVVIKFSTDAKRAELRDPRDLRFGLIGFDLREHLGEVQNAPAKAL